MIDPKFGSEDQEMIVYEVGIRGVSKKLRAASLLIFQESLISNIELVYEARCLTER